MKPKHFLPLPNHPELIDQDKTRYKNVVQWRYEQTETASFLDRDRAVRSATRAVSGRNRTRTFRDDVFGILLVVAGLILYLFWFSG